jgi:hypothetical protein
MRTLLLLLLIGFNQLSTFAQNKKIIFGEIDPDTVKMTAYDKDTSAEAILLYDYGEVTFDYRAGTLFHIMNYHGRIKILKKSALERASVQLTT